MSTGHRWSATSTRNRKMELYPLLMSCALCFLAVKETWSQACIQRRYSSDSVVCVCNSTYCDTVPSIPSLTLGMAAIYTSSQGGERLTLANGKMANTTTYSLVLEINKTVTRQTVMGFGGAFTDAAGINIASLPQAAQEKLLQSYYSPDGIEYTIGRIPMASCDFSTHPYSYDDTEGDLQLSQFALAPEDMKYKIPYIQRALTLSQGKLRLFGSPWSAPAWMKTNKNMTGNGTLIGQPGGPYYKTWANYFVRFVQEYAKNNISLWGLTAQNEPTDGTIYKFSFQCMGWTPETQRDFVKLDLGPALQKNGLQDIKLMILDDDRLFLPEWAPVVLSDPEARKYISGVALHWYLDTVVPQNVLNFIHEKFPDTFLFATEACSGFIPLGPHVILGDWGRGEDYAGDIIDDLNHWVTGWTDWNIALDPQGGPNWVNNFVDSPIIVNASSGEFYKQPMFYVMGHFSKFLVPNSTFVGLKMNAEESGIYATAFLRPDGILAVVILNTAQSPSQLSVHDPSVGYLDLHLPEMSIKTILWATH